MINTIYRLVAPRRFETAFEDIDFAQTFENSDGVKNVLVRPEYLSICRADQRYYKGDRPQDVLGRKLPMALIHEGTGRVIYSADENFKSGDSVIMIPNTPVEKDDVIAENYLESSRFRASGYDGFMQENVVMRSDRLVKLPSNIDKKVAAFTELVSVSVHAISRFEKISHSRRDTIGVWGDGNLGYITSLLLKIMFPESKISIFGVNREKLSNFTFADSLNVVSDIDSKVRVDHAFECVGSDASQKAINQMIDLIRPEGTISLMGVAEYPVPVNTRLVLEKGLRMYGSSRSGREDFERTINLYINHPEIIGYLRNLISSEVVVRNIEDMNIAFENDMRHEAGKTIMIWDK